MSPTPQYRWTDLVCVVLFVVYQANGQIGPKMVLARIGQAKKACFLTDLKSEAQGPTCWLVHWLLILNFKSNKSNLPYSLFFQIVFKFRDLILYVFELVLVGHWS